MAPDNSRPEPSFTTSEGLRRLITRINQAGPRGWRTDPDVPALIEFTIRKYRPLCRSWNRDPVEAASVAFDALASEYALTVDDPWAIVTTAVERYVIAETQAERLLISGHQARRSEHTEWDSPVRAGEYEEFLLNGRAEPIPDDSPSPTGELVAILVTELFALLRWDREIVATAIDFVLVRLARAMNAATAYEYLRRDEALPALLDLGWDAWGAFLGILFDGRPGADGPGRDGLIRRIAMFDPRGNRDDQLAELLADEDLVLAVVRAGRLR